MTHLLVIAIMITASVRDLAPGPLVGDAWLRAHPLLGAVLAVSPYAGLALIQAAVGHGAYRALDRSGEVRFVHVHETVGAVVRVAVLPAHLSALLVFGMLDQVRWVTGDLIALDEMIVLIPPFAVLGVTWLTAEPLERRLREALLIRRLDEGLSIPPMPRPGVWWLGVVRMQLLFAAVPVLLIMAWAEAVGFARDAIWAAASPLTRAEAPRWASDSPQWLHDADNLSWTAAGLQLGGVLLVLALLPIALRYLWDTTPLGPGPLRDRLTALCRDHRVRVRRLLVWHTHGGMINGAVIGVLPRLRYIVLTDALLSTLPDDQVEAVAAHEVAHVRLRHIPWLAGSMLGAAISVGSGASLVARQFGVSVTEGWAPIGVMSAAFATGLVVFGWVSRRFELQADAFAAAHVARSTQDSTLSDAGVAAMAGALRAVALVNGIPMDRFTWRHGSIAGRRRALERAIGEPLAGLAADRTARRAKRLVAVLCLAGVALAVFEALGAVA